MNAGFESVSGCTVQVISTEQEGLDHLPPGVLLTLDVDTRHAEVVLSHQDAATLVSYLTPPPLIRRNRLRDLEFAADLAYLRTQGPDATRIREVVLTLLSELGYQVESRHG